MVYSIAVDIGGTNTRVALVDEGGMLNRAVRSPTPGGAEADIPGFLGDMIRELANPDEIAGSEGIGISAAGPVDARRGAIINPPNLPGKEIILADPLADRFGLPVRLLNDCHAGAIGELLFGAGEGCSDFVYLTLSTGIGAGVISGGKILLGCRGNTAEVGHFYVDDEYSLFCGCGYQGHWEAYASGRHLPLFFSRWCSDKGISLDGIPSRAEEVFGLIRAGRHRFDGFIDALGRINARGISDIIVAYDPGLIILDGGVMRENLDLLLPKITEYTDRYLPLPEIMATRLGGDAPLLGASVLARGYDTCAGSFGNGG
jgi:glucokinase